MDGMSVNSSPATLFTNDPAVQNRNRDEQIPPAPPQQEPPRVNEGPSTVTTISPQAQRLALQEQNAPGESGNAPPPNPVSNASAPPRAETQPPQRGDDGTANPPAAASSNAEPPNQSGRAFDDQSPNSLLRS